MLALCPGKLSSRPVLQLLLCFPAALPRQLDPARVVPAVGARCSASCKTAILCHPIHGRDENFFFSGPGKVPAGNGPLGLMEMCGNAIRITGNVGVNCGDAEASKPVSRAL